MRNDRLTHSNLLICGACVARNLHFSRFISKTTGKYGATKFAIELLTRSSDSVCADGLTSSGNLYTDMSQGNVIRAHECV